MKKTTLLLLVQGAPITHVLLGYKKVGFGKGNYTGIGGKVEQGESLSEAAIRELEEETSVVVQKKHLIPAGHINFFFPAKPTWDLTVHIFLSDKWQGTPKESREICPKWFDIHHLPYDQMWDDAQYWYLKVLRGEKIRADFTFQSNNQTIDTYFFHSISSSAQ